MHLPKYTMCTGYIDTSNVPTIYYINSRFLIIFDGDVVRLLSTLYTFMHNMRIIIMYRMYLSARAAAAVDLIIFSFYAS